MQKVYKVMCLDWVLLSEQLSVGPLLWSHWIVRDSILVLVFVEIVLSFEIGALTLCWQAGEHSPLTLAQLAHCLFKYSILRYSLSFSSILLSSSSWGKYLVFRCVMLH